MIKKILLLILLAYLPMIASAQSKPLKAKLLGTWGDTTIVSSFYNAYNEIWGLAVKGKEYGVIGSTEGTHIVDINTLPYKELYRIKGGQQGTSVIHRDYDEYKGYLYAVCDEGASGLQIMDIRNLPQSAPVVYDSDSLFTTCHNTFVDTLAGKLYACGIFDTKDKLSRGLAVYDIKSNPANPKLLWNNGTIGNFKISYVHDCYVVRDTAYLNCGYQGLVVASFKDPANPVLLGTLTTYKNQGYNHSCYLTEDSKYLVMCDETHGSPVKLVSVAKLDDIQVVSEFSAESSATQIVHNPIVRGKYNYSSYYFDGLTVHDISNAKAPKLAMHYDECSIPDAKSYAGAWGVYPLLPSKRILLSDMQKGIYVLEGIEKTIATATNELTESNINIQLFPQPADAVLNVDIQNSGENENLTPTIIDLQGKIIKTFLITNINNGRQTLSLDTADVPIGLYVLQLKGSEINLVRKVLIVR